MGYTPINKFKLKSNAKDFLKTAERMSIYSIDKIHAPSDVFNALLESISASERDRFRDSIPFEGKQIVRFSE